MASIYRLPSGNWRVQIRQNGRSISKSFPLKADARAWAKSMEGNPTAIDAFPDAEARKRTVGQAIDSYMLDYSGRDPGLVARLAWWKRNHGTVPLASFSQAKIKDALRVLAQENVRHGRANGISVILNRRKSPATLNRYHQAISTVLTWAVDQDWISKNTALGIKRQKEPRGRVRWLSDDERQRLLDACDKSDWADLGLLVRLALSTGARRGELLKIRWSDVDLKKGLAHVGKTKNDDRRVLPLIKPVIALLRKKPRPIRDGLLFASPRDPQRPYYDCRKFWNAAIAEAGISNFKFHDIRHTTASYLAMSGASPIEIGDVLGHKTLAMVRRYSHLATDHKTKLTELVFTDIV